jgi:hypothetical protein
MPFNALHAVGILIHAEGSATSFLGTCFAFRRSTTFLTAAHCLGTLSSQNVLIGLPFISLGTVLPVSGITRHHTADIAILHLPADTEPKVEPFWDFVSNFGWAEEFLAFGYPEDVFGTTTRQPTPRAFTGNYQRYMTFKSHMGYQYNAGEMSIPAPAGLSGGPVFRPGAHVMVTGMVTENLESTTTLDAVEEVQRDGMLQRTTHRKIITYAVALLLDSHGEWLNDHGVRRESSRGA